MASPERPLPVDGPPLPGLSGEHPLVPHAMSQVGVTEVRQALRTAWENRDRLVYAWRVLHDGVCDHCELGPRGLQDDALPGRHLCLKRLERLRDDTIRALVPADVRDRRLLRGHSPEELRAFGRIPYPFVIQRGERGFQRIGWDDALALAGRTLQSTDPQAVGFLAGGRGMTNESLYVFAKTARLLGSAHVDLCLPSALADTQEVLAQALGREASTCSLSDLVGTDLLLLCGTRATQDQPALARLIQAARSVGTRVVTLNAPSDVAWADDALQVGSPAAFLGAVMHLLCLTDAVDSPYLEAHVTGWKKALETARATGLDQWLEAAGARREHAEWLATLIGRSSRWVTVAGPDPEAMAAIVSLHLSQGALGRQHCGIMALGGQGSLQGGRDCGVSPSRLPGGVSLDKAGASDLQKAWGHPVSADQGLPAPEQLKAAAAGDLAVLSLMAADPWTALGPSVEPGLARLDLRIHQGTHLDPSMLIEPADTVLVLPMETPHEQVGGGTITSIERRVRYSPSVDGQRGVGLARPAWQIPVEIALAARPELAAVLGDVNPMTLRAELQAVVADYQGLKTLSGPGDWFQWGGPNLYREGAFQTAGGKARMPEMPTP